MCGKGQGHPGSDGQKVRPWYKADWINPDKSSFCRGSTLLSVSATTLIVHLNVPVFRWPGSQPEELTASQNISITNLSVHPDPHSSSPFPLPQPAVSQASYLTLVSLQTKSGLSKEMAELLQSSPLALPTPPSIWQDFALDFLPIE